MKIARRTGGGRGVYELAGASEKGLGATDFIGLKPVLKFPPFQDIDLGIKLKIQGGKPRFVLDGGEVHVQRQLAAALIMPKPIRADEAMGTGLPIMRKDAYAIEEIDLDSVEQTSGGHFTGFPISLTYRNQSDGANLNPRIRYSRVVALWASRHRFPREISELLERHQAIIAAGGPIPEDAEQIVGGLQTAVAAVAPALGLTFDPRHDVLTALDRVSFSLTVISAAKPFIVLTGPSGTGKSKVAIEFASAFDYGPALPQNLRRSIRKPATCLVFVPVGADWTDERYLLGYPNPFGPPRIVNGQTVHSTYEITPMLKLLLRAVHPDYRHLPHFVILDEMNLSHVERYFSSFLSLLEADRSIGGTSRFELINQENLRLIAEVLKAEGHSPMELEAAEALLREGLGFSFPSNLFIIGTVNVDETTYMFSPKVLDRAFVVELKPSSPGAYLTGGQTAVETIAGMTAQEMLENSIRRRFEKAWEGKKPAEILQEIAHATGLAANLRDEILAGITRVLNGVFKLLDPVGFGFGYRVTNEVVHFISLWLTARRSEVGPADFSAGWQGALDQAVLMKILPKIHGSRRDLGESLRALADFLSGGEASYSIGSQTVGVEAADKLGFPLPQSQEKAALLHRTLQGTGYATFIR